MLSLKTFFGGVRSHTFVYESGGVSITIECVAPATGPHPAVVLLHGSDGLTESGPRFRLMMQALANLGYVALLPHYFDRTGDSDLGSGGRRAGAIEKSFPLWREAIADAVGVVGRLPEVGAHRIGLVGFSLGGFLAIGVAALRPEVRCVIEFCGGLPEDLTAVPLALPPLLILHGEADVTVPVTQAHALAKALQESGLLHEMHVYPGQGHVLTGSAEREALQRSLAFLETHLAKRPGG